MRSLANGVDETGVAPAPGATSGEKHPLTRASDVGDQFVFVLDSAADPPELSAKRDPDDHVLTVGAVPARAGPRFAEAGLVVHLEGKGL